jgi:hypothetical protein
VSSVPLGTKNREPQSVARGEGAPAWGCISSNLTGQAHFVVFSSWLCLTKRQSSQERKLEVERCLYHQYATHPLKWNGAVQYLGSFLVVTVERERRTLFAIDYEETILLHLAFLASLKHYRPIRDKVSIHCIFPLWCA